MMVMASVTQVELETSKQVLRAGVSYSVFGDKKGDGRKDYIRVLVWAVWPNYNKKLGRRNARGS